MIKIPDYIQAVIFDVDGLLIDSEPYWHKTTEIFFAKHNKPFTTDVHHRIMGLGLREMMEYFKKEHGFTGDIDEMVTERKELVYAMLLKEVKLMDGAEELIRALHKKGYPLAIATSAHTQDKTVLMLGKFGLAELFAFYVSGEDVKKAKPAPDIYLQTAKLLKIAPKNCLVLEDAPNGVIAGKAAGMYVIGVNKDQRIAKGLTAAKADVVVESLQEIQI